MKTKEEILEKVERNIDGVYKAVMISFFKNVTPTSPELDNNTVVGILENVFGSTSFRDFEKEYGKTELGGFICNLTEQIHDVNCFRFEAAQEDIAIAESTNPFLLMKELNDSNDKEFKQLVLTDNIKQKLAQIISDDIEKTEIIIKKEAELKDDLDNIDPDSEEFVSSDKGGGFDDDDDENEEDEEEVIDYTEARWLTVNDKLKNVDADKTIDAFVKDKVFINIDMSEKTKIRQHLHNIKEMILSDLRGYFNSIDVELSEYKKDSAYYEYLSYVLTKRANPSIKAAWIEYFVFLSAGVMSAVLVVLTNIIGVVILFLVAPELNKFLNKIQNKRRVHYFLACGIANDLEQKANQATNEEDRNKFIQVRREFMNNMGLIEQDITNVKNMIQDENVLVSKLSKNSPIVEASYTAILKEITEDIVEDVGERANAENIEKIALYATSMEIVKEVFLNDED